MTSRNRTLSSHSVAAGTKKFQYDDEGADEESSELDKNQKIRYGRSRLKERLNWFSSRSRQRLRSFGSSDNLRHMRDGLMRSRDKLSCALSPVRGRIGSYHLSEVGVSHGGEIEGQVSLRSRHWPED